MDTQYYPVLKLTGDKTHMNGIKVRKKTKLSNKLSLGAERRNVRGKLGFS